MQSSLPEERLVCIFWVYVGWPSSPIPLAHHGCCALPFVCPHGFSEQSGASRAAQEHMDPLQSFCWSSELRRVLSEWHRVIGASSPLKATSKCSRKTFPARLRLKKHGKAEKRWGSPQDPSSFWAVPGKGACPSSHLVLSLRSGGPPHALTHLPVCSFLHCLPSLSVSVLQITAPPGFEPWFKQELNKLGPRLSFSVSQFVYPHL